MGTMPVGRLLLGMSWPAIISMIIQAMYNVVDSIFVSRVGEDALAAITLIYPLQFLMMSVGIGTAVGINSLISRRLGARRKDEADLAGSNGFRLAFINWIIFAVPGFFFSEMFMKIFSDDPQIVSMGRDYLMIVTTLCLFLMITVTVEKIIQATGNMKLPMFASITGAVVNIALDPVMIFGLLGFPELGVAGAAIATVIGQMSSACINLIVLFRAGHDVHVDIRRRFDKGTIRDIYSVGLPSIVMQAIGSVMQFGMNIILAGFSTTAVAVMGVYGRLQSFVFMPSFGINQGSMPVFGYNYGAGDKKRLMKAYRIAFLMALGIMSAGLVVFQVFPHQLLSIFNASPDMYEIGEDALRRISLCFLPAAFGIISGGMFQATGHGVLSLFASLIRQMAGILPLAVILGHIWGLSAVWWSFPLAEILGTLYIAVMMRRLYSREIINLTPVSGHEV